MVRTRIVSLALVLLSLGNLSGCSDSPEDGTAFNRTLGDGAAGAPILPGPIDKGILGDQSAYQPTAFDAISPDSGTASSGSTASSGDSSGGDEAADEAAIRELSATLMTGMLDGDIELVLDCFVDEQVEALRDGEFIETAEEIVTGLQDVWDTLETKSAGTDVEPMLAFVDDLPVFLDLFGAINRPEFTSETTAQLVPDLEGFQAVADEKRDELVAVFDRIIKASSGGAAGAPDGGTVFDQMMQQILLEAENADPDNPAGLNRLIKVDGDWRYELPVTITEDQADAFNAAALAVKDFIDQLNGQLAAQQQLSTQELMPIGFGLMGAAASLQQQVMLEIEPVIEEWTEEMGAGDSGDDGAGANAVDAPSFSDDLATIIVDRCAYCHQPGGRPFDAGLPIDLSVEKAYASITEGASSRDEDLAFIVPGDADASYFFEKISSDAPAHGEQMPIRDDPLDAEEIALFEAWINAGAPDN